jgi:hypothetical protein
MFKIMAFIVLTVGLIYISRGSLRAPRSHGFYRFFAWELIVALFLLNIDTASPRSTDVSRDAREDEGWEQVSII